MYRENPKTKGSGIICAIPQTGTCPNGCEDCYFQSGRSHLEPLAAHLPNMPPSEKARIRVLRVNDGHDSNVDRSSVMAAVKAFDMKFYNTAIPKNLSGFDAPVVLTVNPGQMTDIRFYRLDPIPLNLMFVRIRTNTWNLEQVVHPAAQYYAEREVPVVLTFLAYFNTVDKIPATQRDNYVFRKRTLNAYRAITTAAWRRIMHHWEGSAYEKWVYSCGKVEGEDGSSACRHCGNCLREYFAAMERIRKNNCGSCS